MYERRIDGCERERFAFLSGPFRRKEDAEAECHRMTALPQYDGCSLGMTFVAESPKKHKLLDRTKPARRRTGHRASYRSSIRRHAPSRVASPVIRYVARDKSQTSPSKNCDHRSAVSLDRRSFIRHRDSGGLRCHLDSEHLESERLCHIVLDASFHQFSVRRGRQHRFPSHYRDKYRHRDPRSHTSRPDRCAIQCRCDFAPPQSQPRPADHRHSFLFSNLAW